MPNLLAHFGTHGLASRAAGVPVSWSWILLGCLIPDLPWILQRAWLALAPFLDPYDLRLYAIGLASWTGCLLVSAALAAAAAAPLRAFAVLSANASAHLLLDSLQTKWAAGVHWLAPWSWQGVSWTGFWPESLIGVSLTVAGLGGVLYAARSAPEPLRPGLRGGRRAWILAGLLATAALAFPLPFLDAIQRADVQFVGTLRDRPARPGRYVELDRYPFRPAEEGGSLRIFSGEVLILEGDLPRRPGVLSVRGRFRTPVLLEVQDAHLHWPWYRDGASYLALALVVWIVARELRAERMRRA